jgi:hypothetical protein
VSSAWLLAWVQPTPNAETVTRPPDIHASTPKAMVGFCDQPMLCPRDEAAASFMLLA